MTNLRLAVATRCFRQRLKQSIVTAREAGAAGVAFDLRQEVVPAEFTGTGRKQLLHLLSEHDLKVASTTFPLRRPLAEPEQLEARLAALRSAMEFTFALGADVLTARIGRLPRDRESDEYATLCEIVNDLARHGNRVGVTLAITPMRESTEDSTCFFERITEGPVGWNCDPAVLAMAGQNATDAVRTLHDWIFHVAIRDGVQDLEGSGAEVAVGRGETKWDEFLAVLQEAEYRGWMTAERTAGDDPTGDIGRALQYVQNVAWGN